MSSINLADLELLSNKKKLSKYVDKDKLSQSIQIEQIISQINNISKNDPGMLLNTEFNNSIKHELEILISSYFRINELVRCIKITNSKFFIENLLEEIISDAVSKSNSISNFNLSEVKVVNLESKK
jgi:hypothetical protein